MRPSASLTPVFRYRVQVAHGLSELIAIRREVRPAHDLIDDRKEPDFVFTRQRVEEVVKPPPQCAGFHLATGVEEHRDLHPIRLRLERHDLARGPVLLDNEFVHREVEHRLASCVHGTECERNLVGN